MTFLLLALFAIWPAWRDRKLAALAAAMVFVIGFSLLVLPGYRGTVGWYQACAQLEMVIILACFLFRHPAGFAVAGISGANILWNYLAFTDYMAGVQGAFWLAYKANILKGQFGQIAALLLFSPPSVNVIEALIFRNPKNKADETWTAKALRSG